ncbi:phage tail protein [Marinomonas fungiae]|uniref:phage tail protein n=1 Tax=Marinomonas fungiae TaxID=1137284 RepID=UPI003A91717B
MQEQFIGQINTLGFNFTPANFALCQGQILAISQNTALFSLIGSMYGGDARVSFGVPDLRGRCAVGQGDGPGLISRQIGSRYGQERVQLGIGNLPEHSHSAVFTPIPAAGPATASLTTVSVADTNEPNGNYLATLATTYSGRAADTNGYATTTGGFGVTTGELNGLNIHVPASDGTVTVGNTGSGTPFTVSPPSQVVSYAICLDGLYPSRA